MLQECWLCLLFLPRQFLVIFVFCNLGFLLGSGTHLCLRGSFLSPGGGPGCRLPLQTCRGALALIGLASVQAAFVSPLSGARISVRDGVFAMFARVLRWHGERTPGPFWSVSLPGLKRGALGLSWGCWLGLGRQPPLLWQLQLPAGWCQLGARSPEWVHHPGKPGFVPAPRLLAFPPGTECARQVGWPDSAFPQGSLT